MVNRPLGRRGMQSHGECRTLQRRKAHLKCCLRAATGYAFTIVLAAFAFTFTSLPKAILVPALVAGLWRVLIMQRPGMTNLPAFFTSAVARAAKLSMIPAHCFGFSSFCLGGRLVARLDHAKAGDDELACLLHFRRCQSCQTVHDPRALLWLQLILLRKRSANSALRQGLRASLHRLHRFHGRHGSRSDLQCCLLALAPK